MNPKHEPHTVSTVDFKRPTRASNGRYVFRHREQSFSKPLKKVNHQVQAVVNPPSSFINSDNNYVDFRIPDAVKGYLADIELEYTLANANSTTAVSVNASAPWHFDRVEVLENGNMLGYPIQSEELYLTNTVYFDDHELEQRQPYNLIDNETLELDLSNNSVPLSSSKYLVLKLRTILDAAKIIMADVSGEITIRVYSRNKTKWCNDANVSDLSLSEMKLFLTEVEYHGGENSSGTKDYRYNAFSHEQTSLALTNGTTTKYITNNFHDDLYSHCFVLVRNNGATLEQYEDFYSLQNLYFETQGNQNMHNGVQLSDSQHKRIYVDRFPNDGITFANKQFYCICPSTDPVKDLKGQVHGTDMLPKNFKVCLTADSTSGGATRQIDVYAVIPRLVRVLPSGQIRLV